MKKFKTTITVECTEEWYNKNAIEMKTSIETGDAKKQFMTPKDSKEGISNVEITFEDISL